MDRWIDKVALILTTDKNTKYKKIEPIWDAKKDDIMDMFRGCEIELLCRFGHLGKMSITVL